MSSAGIQSAIDAMYAPAGWVRHAARVVFAVACFLATLTGVVVLSILLGSVVAAALGQTEGRPWYDLGSNLRELAALLVRLVRADPGETAAVSGFRVGVISSLWLLALVTLFAVPVGIGAAVYLEEYARPGRLKSIVETNIANLAGVPSIVYGILGLTVFVRAFGFRPFALGYSLWSGALTLGLLVLPTIIIAAQEALRAVPPSLRQASLALGATRWQTVRDHVIPSAAPGILTGVILAISRAIGETAPVLMVTQATSLLDPPRGPWDSYAPLPLEIYNYARFPTADYQALAAGGILLLLMLLLSLNGIAIFLRNWYGRHPRG
ncbi:MAG: phosphate transport system permease protein PstA [Isosphaeraceae bacterium]|nr:MAG: phosphate transport system permease protein PstA [Isosphaeraceae bacterium]